MDNSWRTGIHIWLNETFPHAESHREVKCCMGGVGSLTGTFDARAKFTEQKPDLVFIEYSLVDFYKEAPLALTERSVEALVRVIRSINPDCEICFLYFFCFKTDDHFQGRHTPVEKVYEAIADHYGIPSISVAQFMLELHNTGTMHLTGENSLPAIYRRDMCHPTIEGNRQVVDFLCGQLKELLARKPAGRSSKLPASVSPVRIEDWRSYKVQPRMLSGRFETHEFVPAKLRMAHPKMLSERFETRRIAAGKELRGQRKKNPQCLVLRPGGKISFRIRGHLVAIGITIGPNSGVVRCRVGDKVEVRNLFGAFCFRDTISMYVPNPYPDVQQAPQEQEVVLQLLRTVPPGIREPLPATKPSDWMLVVTELRVIGRLL